LDDHEEDQFANMGAVESIQDRMGRLEDRISNTTPRSNNKSSPDRPNYRDYKDYFTIQTRTSHVVEQAEE